MNTTTEEQKPATESSQGRRLSLEERLEQGVVLCAEGYLFELERRGYVQVGSYVPEVVLLHPEVVEQLHREFVRCGSDVVEAFTYYAHREKMRLIGKEHLLEQINKKALEIAKKVAYETNTLFAGNICNTNVYMPDDQKSADEARAMFEEQVAWAKEAGADFIIAETFPYLGEALIAVDVIKKAGLPSVVTLAVGKTGVREGCSIVEAGKQLKAAGATVFGVNCARGPATMLPLLKELVDEVGGYVAGLPVPIRTTPENPTMQNLCSEEHMYTELEPHTLTRYEMADFCHKAAEMGVKYIGMCCGGQPQHMRSMAEALGRHPPASEFSPDLSLHWAYGNHPKLRQNYIPTKKML